MGIAGSATATVIAQCAQVVLLQWLFMTGNIQRQYKTRAAWRLSLPRMWELVRIGAFSGFTIFLDVANWAVFTSFVVGHFGTVSLAAHNAAIGFMHFCFMPALGINQGISVIVGQYIGRRDFDTAVARTYTALRIAMVYMFCTGVIFAVFGRSLIHFVFRIDDPGVLSLGHKLLIMASVFQAFDAINIAILGALRGAGDTRWIAMIIFVGCYLFFLPISLALAFGAGWGAVGAWVGATIYIIGLSLVLLMRFRGGRWRHIQIFLEPPVA
jgi:MATE family multidrug resistance protein